MPQQFKIPNDNMHGCSIKFSTFTSNQLVVATSQLYGHKGNGALYILNFVENDKILLEKEFTWSDALLDVCWSKNCSNQLLTGSGDGSLQLWDLTFQKPIQIYKEHHAEVTSIDWATINQNPQLLSGSWDGTVKLWDPARNESLATFHHQIYGKNKDTCLIFSVSFSGGDKNLFASVGTDGYLKIWNSNDMNVVTNFQTHNTEVLTCDWVKDSDHLIGTGGADGSIKIFDLRNYTEAISVLKTHDGSALRKIKFSPHASTVLASVGYDSVTRYSFFVGNTLNVKVKNIFYFRIWDYTHETEPLHAICHHKDCVCGIDWDSFNEDRLGDCGWDNVVNVFNVT